MTLLVICHLTAIRARISKKGGALVGYGFLIMVVTHAFTHLFTRVHTTLFPVLKAEFSLSLQQLGLIAAIPPLCQMLLSIPVGLLSDKIGSRKLIMVSLGTTALASILAFLAQSPVLLIVAVSLAYISTTIYHTAAYSFVTRLFKPRKRPKALGLHGAGGTLGIALGPLSISVIMGILALGWRQVYLFWFIPFLLGMIAVLGIKSEPTEDVGVDHVEAKRNPQATSLRSASLVMFLLFLGIRTIAKSTTESFMALYMVENRGVSQSLAGLLIGSNTLVGVLAAPVGGFLATRYGEKRWLLTVLALAYACFGLAIATPNNTVFVILYLAYGFSTLLGMAANSAIMASLSPGKQRGLAYALFFLPGSIVGAVAPIVAGSLAETYSLATIFYASAAVFFISLGTLQFGVKLQDSA